VDALLVHNRALFADAVHHIVLPAGVLALGVSAYLSRMTRAFMLEQLQSSHVLAARAKGLSKRQVLWNHAFRNTRMQLITIVALTAAHLLEGSVLVESVFAWPGFGQYFTQALLIGDMNAVVACTLLTGAIFVTANLAVEHLHHRLDPRTVEAK
jgi:peptide/nickel transport system permease protein